MFKHPRNKKGYIIENKFKDVHELHISIDYLASNLNKFRVGQVIEVDDYVTIYLCKVKESFRHTIAKKEHIIMADVIYSHYVVITEEEFKAKADASYSYFPCVVLEDKKETLDHYAKHKYNTYDQD